MRLVLDIKGLLHAFRSKEEDARVDVDAYMEYCAKAVSLQRDSFGSGSPEAVRS